MARLVRTIEISGRIFTVPQYVNRTVSGWQVVVRGLPSRHFADQHYGDATQALIAASRAVGPLLDQRAANKSQQKEYMRYKQELAAVNSALGQDAKQIERDKIDAARFRRLCELHDSVETMWHVRGSDGQPIAVGGLASALDQKNELAKAF